MDKEKTYEYPCIMGSHPDDIGYLLGCGSKATHAGMLHRVAMAMSLCLLDCRMMQTDDSGVQVEVDVKG
jgi:hypothetical protein